VKKKVSVILAAIALQAFIPLANAKAVHEGVIRTIPYSDINGQTVYLKSILDLSDRKIINGNLDGTFRPDNCVNRAEFLKMLFVAQGVDINDMPSGGAGYTDLDSKEWYYPYVKIATVKGTVNGYPDGTFRPGQCVNRVEAMKMTVKEFAFTTPEADFGLPKDIDPLSWYYSFYLTATLKNLVGTAHLTYQNSESTSFTIAPGSNINDEGWFATFFHPSEALTRKEAAEMINRSLYVSENNLTQYPQAYTYSPYITEFDSCGPLNNYSDNEWYPDLITALEAAGESNRISSTNIESRTESCLSLDKNTLITLLKPGYIEGNSRMFKFTIGGEELHEANYYLFTNNASTNKPFISFHSFGQRTGLSIPLTGEDGDGGYGTKWQSQYHYNENAVYLQKACSLEYNPTTDQREETGCESTGY